MENVRNDVKYVEKWDKIYVVECRIYGDLRGWIGEGVNEGFAKSVRYLQSHPKNRYLHQFPTYPTSSLV